MLTNSNNLLLHLIGNEVAIASDLKSIGGVTKVERIRSVSSDCTEFIVRADKDKDVRKDLSLIHILAFRGTHARARRRYGDCYGTEQRL